MISSEEFTHEYEQWRGQTRWLLREWGVNPDELDDHVQDAWTRAWEHRDEFRHQSQLHTWVSHIAKNQMLMERRSADHRYRSKLEAIDKRVSYNDGQSRVILNSVEMQINKTIKRAKIYIKYLYLHELDGYSPRQIAKRVGMSYRGFKTFLFRTKPVVLRELGRP